jgi:hypothetical protein
MIADYKLYHGAVLAELVDESTRTVGIRESVEEGRLHSYVLDERIGLHIKHSAARLPPWQFTFTPANGQSLEHLREQFGQVFVVLVCWLDGMVCLSLDELEQITAGARPVQGWVRAERSKNEWYSVSGQQAGLKKPQGLSGLIDKLERQEARAGAGSRLWRRMFG